MEEKISMEKMNATYREESPFYVREWLGVRPAALLEMLIFFLLFFLYDIFFGSQDRMIHAHTHPFWIIVVLMSVQYGAAEGLIAVALSALFLYSGNLPVQGFKEDYFDYQFRLYKLPFMWLLTALVLGELQERKNRIRRELEKNLHETEVREEEITRSYDSLKKVKENLESRLAGQLTSSIATYEALKKMEGMKPAKVILGVDELVRNVLNPEKYSLFALGPNGLEAVTDWGWTEEDHYTRRFMPTSDLYINLVGKQKLLCVLNREDEAVLHGEGLLAAPLMDESTGTIFGVLKIEALDLEELNLSQIEAFRAIASFAGVAYAQASNYQRLLKNTIYDVSLPIFSPALYQVAKDEVLVLCREAKQPLAAIDIEIVMPFKPTKEVFLGFVEKLRHFAIHHLGPTSRFFRTKSESPFFTLLVPMMHHEKLYQAVDKLHTTLDQWNRIPKKSIRIDVEWLVKDEVGL